MAGTYGREEAYRSGNKVYGSGRNSPHMGTRLDPSGYVERELKRKRTDNRSRLAQSALLRLRGNTRDRKQSRQDKSRMGSIPRSTPSSQQAYQDNKKRNYRDPGSAGPRSGSGITWGQIDAQQAGQPAADPFAPPKVDLNGKLIPMPWQMQMDWLNASTDLAQQNAGWDSQLGQAGMQLGDTLRELARQKVIDSRNIAGGNASRGMSFSSGNAQDIVENQAAYGRADAEANNWYNQLAGEIGQGGTQRALAQSSFENYAAMLQAEAARRLAERAGTLGFGQDNTVKNPPKKDNKKKDRKKKGGKK